MIVPDKTVAYYPVLPDMDYNSGKKFSVDHVKKFLKPLNEDHKRDWFTPHFYKCLPLSIANMQGFVFSVPYDFEVMWDGGTSLSSVKIKYVQEKDEDFLISIKSEFGYGIFTIHFPLILRTPPGINLMTIAPPNFPTPGLSPMSGVIETDNLKFTFTLNIKIDLVNTVLRIPANQPVMGAIPIPRYFCDSFELKNAHDIFDSDTIQENIDIYFEHAKKRETQNTYDTGQEGSYFRGMDIRGNKFKDHQLPRKKKK